MWSVAPSNAADRVAGRTARSPGGFAAPPLQPPKSSLAAPGQGAGQQKKLPGFQPAKPGGASGLPGLGGAKGPTGRPAGWGAGSTSPTLLSGQRPQPHKLGQEGTAGQDDSGEVAAFLKELGLAQYTEALLASGFDEMDTLLHIEDADMKEVGMNPCHVVKLRRRLQELQRQGGEGAELDEGNPVVAFLKDIGMSQYAETLLQSGFDELDTLSEIEDHDMRDLGIPRGHAVKLRRRLKEYQAAQECAPQPAKAWGPPAGAGGPRPRPAAASQPESLPSDQMKTAVERSWERVQALGACTVGELLYRHTFVIEPAVMELFPVEVRCKYRDWTADEGAEEGSLYDSPALRKLFSKFVNAIGCTVAGLHDFGRLVPMLTQLGGRHANYGLNEGHWPILGKALMFTLRDCLGEEFTGEVEAAWSMVYGFMSNIMIEGLRGAQAQKLRKDGGGSSVDDDCRSEDDSLTTGLPSECDGNGKDSWTRQNSALTEVNEDEESAQDLAKEPSPEVPPEVQG